jgi:hypothetical protein
MIVWGVGGLGVGGGAYPPPLLGMIGGIALIAFLLYVAYRAWRIMTGFILVGFFALFFIAALLIFHGANGLMHR